MVSTIQEKEPLTFTELLPTITRAHREGTFSVLLSLTGIDYKTDLLI